MEILSQYVVVIIMAICLCVGYIIKNSIKFIPNDFIPLIMGILGTFLNVWYSGWMLSPEILLGGLASGLAATGAFELVKNVTSKTEKENTDE